MTFVILEIDSGNGDARTMEAWDWNSLIEPDVGDVKVNAFDSAEELETVIVERAAKVHVGFDSTDSRSEPSVSVLVADREAANVYVEVRDYGTGNTPDDSGALYELIEKRGGV